MTFDVLTTALTALTTVAENTTETQLEARTPCSDWTVSQVLLHAAGDQRGWAAVVGSASFPGYDPFQPPHEVEGGVTAEVKAAADVAGTTWAQVDPEAESLPTPLPPVPTMAPGLAAAAAALDAAIHAWDVAVATGQPSPLTAELAHALRPAADAVAEPLRGFAYAPALAEQGDDDEVAALLRYLGRDPHWA